MRSDANSPGPVDVSGSPHARLQPLAAEIDGGLWAERRRLNREVLLVEGARKLEEAGNFHNLRVAAGQEDGEFVGMRFADSDVYKWLEALGWELGREPSEALAALSDTATELVAAAQEPSGYLNSYFQVDQTEAEHFVNLAWDHELYCAGHLIQAAIAHARGTGDTRLLDVARRLADHIGEVFGPGRNEGTPGHPEIETALVELHRLTGEPRYLELAGFLVDTRGHETLQPARFGSAYFQDHMPVREATEVAGHCVRQLYLDAGVTDLHLETGEAALLDVLQARWQDMTERKMYLTGGLGAHHTDEAFGDPYELPPDRCYGETCAAIASLHWNWRMLLLTGEARFADLFERALYNGFNAGLSLDGRGYSYVNPLHVRDQHRGTVRQPWFACACCPPNVMRTLASLHHYLATSDDGGVQIHQYASGRIRPERSSRSPPTTRGTAGSRSRSPRPARRRGRWTCACRRGRRARGWRSTTTSSSRPRPATRASSGLERRRPRHARAPARAAADRAAPARRRRPRLPGDRARPARLLRRGGGRARGRDRRRPADRPGGRAARRAVARPARRDRRGRGRRRARAARRTSRPSPARSRCARSPTRTGATAARARCASGSLSARRSRAARARAGRTRGAPARAGRRPPRLVLARDQRA